MMDLLVMGISIHMCFRELLLNVSSEHVAALCSGYMVVRGDVAQVFHYLAGNHAVA